MSITIVVTIMNQRIITKQQTKLRHQAKSCKVVEVKVDKSTLTKKTLLHLNSLFIQGKYFYNHCISQENLNSLDTKIKTVPVKILDKFEDRILNVLSSQMKQSLKTKIFSNILTLHTLKSKGKKVGKLKYISELRSIPLKQYGMTYKIEFENSRIRLQGLKQKLKVSGLNQIRENAEIANAHLVKKCGNFYFHITTFIDKTNVIPPELSVGIDFGCQTQLTLSNGIKIEFQIPVSDRLKRLDRKIMKNNRPKSKNKYKDQLKRQKEYEHIKNQKDDIRKKLVSVLTKNYKYVIFQDESIKAWKASNHGKKIQNSGIGGIIRDLKLKSHTPVEVNKFFPSTQLCPQCGHKQKMPQEIRIYLCENCGYKKDRDLKSAICIESEGIKEYNKIHTDCMKFKLEETETSVCGIINLLKQINNLHVSFCH